MELGRLLPGFASSATLFSFRAYRATHGRFPVDEVKGVAMKTKLKELRRLARDNAARVTVAVLSLPAAMAANAQAVDPLILRSLP